ncbi:MAG: ABC transporter substrate-binding protein [Deltaproteobacteria bacterium]|nr:ABC transporter substrate-binding protein [Deltaproteobacteria bacterium]
MSKILSTLAAAAFSLFVATSASAGPATDLVRTKQAQLFKVIAEPASDAQQTKLNQLFDEMIAYDEFAARSLGEKWSERSDAEKKRFSTLLTELVRANYRKNIKKLIDFDVSYDKEGASDGATTVTTLAKPKRQSKEPDIEVEFRLQTIGGKLKVVDIVTEKASMVKTFRSQFLKVLNKDGFEALIGKMQKKLDKLNKGS